MPRLPNKERSITTLSQRISERRFVIGVDYGTTYTGIPLRDRPQKALSNYPPGVAYATPSTGELPLDEIDLVEDWGLSMGNLKKVPSVISFSQPTDAMEQQWGSDLSEKAVAMIHTKLQLDVQDVAGELDLMVHALEGMKNLNFEHLKEDGVLPAYTGKSAEQIVTEYLSRVFGHLSDAIENFSEEFKAQFPVDIVITVPTVRIHFNFFFFFFY